MLPPSASRASLFPAKGSATAAEGETTCLGSSSSRTQSAIIADARATTLGCAVQRKSWLKASPCIMPLVGSPCHHCLGYMMTLPLLWSYYTVPRQSCFVTFLTQKGKIPFPGPIALTLTVTLRPDHSATRHCWWPQCTVLSLMHQHYATYCNAWLRIWSITPQQSVMMM